MGRLGEPDPETGRWDWEEVVRGDQQQPRRERETHRVWSSSLRRE
jgi:hypothetical protein